MNKQFCIFYLLFFPAQLSFAQSEQGGRLTAMGNNGAAVKDIWGVATNPASITSIKSATIQINYQKYFFAKELSSEAIAFVFPRKRYSFGLNLQRYGIQEFNTIKVGLIFTKQFGTNLSIGLRANYHQIKITSYGATTGVSLDIGAFYQLNEEVSLGFYLNNPSKELYDTRVINITIPTIVHMGIAYKTNGKLLLATTLSKELHVPWDVAIGIDYQLIKSFGIRSGVSLVPFKQYLGIGFNSMNFLIDFTFTKGLDFGYSPQITIGYVF